MPDDAAYGIDWARVRIMSTDRRLHFGLFKRKPLGPKLKREGRFWTYLCRPKHIKVFHYTEVETDVTCSKCLTILRKRKTITVKRNGVKVKIPI